MNRSLLPQPPYHPQGGLIRNPDGLAHDFAVRIEVAEFPRARGVTIAVHPVFSSLTTVSVLCQSFLRQI